MQHTIDNLKQEIRLKDEQIKSNYLASSLEIEILESKAEINPILKEGLLNMEKWNKMSSNLLAQYKEHILHLANANSNLTKKLKTLASIEEKYEEAKQQNELYEKELKALEENVRLFEDQLDRKQSVSIIWYSLAESSNWMRTTLKWSNSTSWLCRTTHKRKWTKCRSSPWFCEAKSISRWIRFN